MVDLLGNRTIMTVKADDVLVEIRGEHASVERHISPEWTFGKLKARNESITGVPPATQAIELVAPDGTKLQLQGPDNLLVSAFNIQPGSILQVTDTRPRSEQFDFDADVEKYEMPLSEYEKRSDSVLEWKKQNGLGRFQSDSRGPVAAHSQETEEPVDFNVGDDCWIKLSSGETAKGSVAYIGAVDGIPKGTWVGVRLESARGKNDGTVKDRRYFDAPANHGVFVRPSAVVIDDLDEL